MKKIKMIVNPLAYGGNVEFHSLNKKQKAFVVVGNTNGHFWLQFHEAKGLLTSYIHQSEKGFYTEDGLIMPKYVHYLLSAAIHYINQH